MATRRLIGFPGVLLAMGALAMAFTGCGGGQATGPDGEVTFAPVVNPAPGVVPLDQEHERPSPAGRTP